MDHPDSTGSFRVINHSIPQQPLQLLGQYLFPVVYNFNPSQAAKIPGMMLELPEREIISLVKAETHDGIEEYVLEAQRVLRDSSEISTPNNPTSTAGTDVPNNSAPTGSQNTKSKKLRGSLR